MCSPMASLWEEFRSRHLPPPRHGLVGTPCRHSLAAMQRDMRAVAHELAQQYGLATQSYGQEPHRHVELFKTDTAGVPSKLLSRCKLGPWCGRGLGASAEAGQLEPVCLASLLCWCWCMDGGNRSEACSFKDNPGIK